MLSSDSASAFHQMMINLPAGHLFLRWTRIQAANPGSCIFQLLTRPQVRRIGFGVDLFIKCIFIFEGIIGFVLSKVFSQ